MSDFNYGDIIEYIDGTLDDNLEQAMQWACEHNVSFDELVDKRDLPKRYFQIGEKQEEPVVPEKPEIEKIKERVAELHSLLDSTDWVANKITDLMVLKPEGYEETIEKYRDVLIKRQEYRDELNGLENLTSTR